MATKDELLALLEMKRGVYVSGEEIASSLAVSRAAVWKAVEALREAEKRLYEAVDKLFAGNMSEAFFGRMNPFSPVGGRFYCELAIEAVGEYITKEFGRETAAMNKRVASYTGRYEKGKKK